MGYSGRLRLLYYYIGDSYYIRRKSVQKYLGLHSWDSQDFYNMLVP